MEAVSPSLRRREQVLLYARRVSNLQTLTRYQVTQMLLIQSSRKSNHFAVALSGFIAVIVVIPEPKKVMTDGPQWIYRLKR